MKQWVGMICVFFSSAAFAGEITCEISEYNANASQKNVSYEVNSQGGEDIFGDAQLSPLSYRVTFLALNSGIQVWVSDRLHKTYITTAGEKSAGETSGNSDGTLSFEISCNLN